MHSAIQQSSSSWNHSVRPRRDAEVAVGAHRKPSSIRSTTASISAAVGAVGDEGRRLEQRGEQHVGERLDRLAGDRSGRHAGGERLADQAEPVALGELAPDLGGQHRRCVEEADAADVVVGGDVEVRHRPPTELLERLGCGHRRLGDPAEHLVLDLLVHRLEQRLLGLEVVVHGAAGHAGSLDDLLAAGAGEALLGEQLPGGGEQRRPGRGPALGLRAAVTSVTLDGHRPP